MTQRIHKVGGRKYIGLDPRASVDERAADRRSARRALDRINPRQKVQVNVTFANGETRSAGKITAANARKNVVGNETGWGQRWANGKYVPWSGGSNEVVAVSLVWS